MKSRLLTLCCIVLLPGLGAALPARAQTNPCGADFNFSVSKTQLTEAGVNWSRIGRQMQGCDSLLVMSKAAFSNVVVERAYFKALSDSLEILARVLQEGQDLRGELLAQQDDFIKFQQEKIVEYDSLLVRSNQLVRDATRNTDRALRQIYLYKFLATGGIVLGAAGLVIGAVLAL